MGRIKRYTSGKWIDSNDVRIRKSNNFNTKATVKRYTSGKWDTISEEKYVKTWDVSWTQSYDDNGNKKPAYADLGRMYQGQYGNPDSYIYGQPWEIQRSMMGFSSSVYTELKDARIEKMELYLHIQWAWYWAGAVATLGLHNASSEPTKFQYSRYAINETRYNSRDEGKWITLDKSIADLFSKGTAKGFTLYKNSENVLYYGYWFGTNGGDKKPKIRVTYYK
ncbi:hypothetical protein [Enterococcus sp. N249-2]